jgi:hypothetical protein
MFTSKEEWDIKKAKNESLKCQRIMWVWAEKKFNQTWSMWCCVEINDELHHIIITNTPLQENACWIWLCNVTLYVYKFNMCTAIDKWKVWKEW